MKTWLTALTAATVLCVAGAPVLASAATTTPEKPASHKMMKKHAMKKHHAKKHMAKKEKAASQG